MLTTSFDISTNSRWFLFKVSLSRLSLSTCKSSVLCATSSRLPCKNNKLKKDPRFTLDSRNYVIAIMHTYIVYCNSKHWAAYSIIIITVKYM